MASSREAFIWTNDAARFANVRLRCMAAGVALEGRVPTCIAPDFLDRTSA
jgi:hypothetical protein